MKVSPPIAHFAPCNGRNGGLPLKLACLTVDDSELAPDAASDDGGHLPLTVATTSLMSKDSVVASSNLSLKDFSHVIEVASDGDVIFSFSSDRTHLVIRVHSTVLRHASQPFRAMFGPHLSEGRDINLNNIEVVMLPDDDSAATSTICRVLHYQQVIDQSALPLLRKITVLAVKYDLASVLRIIAWKHLLATPVRISRT